MVLSISTEMNNHHHINFRTFLLMKKEYVIISSHSPFFLKLPVLGNH